MINKLLLAAVFAACILLGHGPVAFAQTEKRAEPAKSEENQEPKGSEESWFSGEASPEGDTAAEQRAEKEVVKNLDPVDPSETRPSPGQVDASGLTTSGTGAGK